MLEEAGPAPDTRLASAYLEAIWSRVVAIWIQLHGGSKEEFNATFWEPIHAAAVQYIETGRSPDEIAEFHQQALTEICSDPRFKDELLAIIDRWLALVCAHVLTSDIYEEKGAISASWESAFLAQSCLGTLLERSDFSIETFTQPDSIRRLSKLGNDERHRENRSVYEQACRWLDLHFNECKSKDEAAKNLMREVPMEFRTTRRYVDRWLKSKQLPGRE